VLEFIETGKIPDDMLFDANEPKTDDINFEDLEA